MRQRHVTFRPRPYQTEGINKALALWKKKRSTLIICPTGGGKTFMFCKLAEKMRPRGRVLILADRELLVEQAHEEVEKLTPLSSAIEMAEQKVNLRRPPDVVCASVQTMARRLEDFDADLFALVVVDEADLALAPTYVKVLRHFGKHAKILGVTGTPDRGDEQPLGRLFKSVALKVSLRDLIRRKYLARVRQHVVKVLDLSLITKKKRGDFNEEKLGEILTEEKPLHEVVASTRKLAGDRPTLVFAATVDHAQKLAALFNRYEKGSARAIDGSMNPSVRRSILAPFRNGEFQFLCNCALLTRGIDLPLISCIAMARPTMSRPLYAQMLGRGTRQHPGKRDLLVLDFTDNALRHSLITALDVVDDGVAPEVKARAEEVLDEAPGGDVDEVLDAATRELAVDPALRARVLAKVRLQTRTIGLGIDWAAISDETWRTTTNTELARRFHCAQTTVGEYRPAHIPPPIKQLQRALAAIPAKLWRSTSDTELARRFHCSQTMVMEYRPAHIPSPRSARRRSLQRALAAIPAKLWRSTSNIEIARRLRCDQGTVGEYRPAHIPSPGSNAQRARRRDKNRRRG